MEMLYIKNINQIDYEFDISVLLSSVAPESIVMNKVYILKNFD